jgi:hypothetical protein
LAHHNRWYDRYNPVSYLERLNELSYDIGGKKMKIILRDVGEVIIETDCMKKMEDIKNGTQKEKHI